MAKPRAALTTILVNEPEKQLDVLIRKAKRDFVPKKYTLSRSKPNLAAPVELRILTKKYLELLPHMTRK